MGKIKIRTFLILILLLAIVGVGIYITSFLRGNINLTAFTSQPEIAQLNLPPGFEFEVYADNLDNPRFLRFDPDGSLLVAERGAGRILRLQDNDLDGKADRIDEFISGLDRPHSLAYFAPDWYVGVPTGIVRLTDQDNDGLADLSRMVVNDIPGSGQHTTRTVEFMPDGRMLLSVGSSCNACIEEDSRRAAILIYKDKTGSNEAILASGLRNAVGLALHPVTGELWATNNARDLLGDNLPPDSLHQITAGMDFGWPACHAGEVVDPELGEPGACDETPKPALKIQAHSAPLGLAFYEGSTFPEKYQHGLFIAYHGSWNRSIPTGYKVVFVPFEDGQPTGVIEDFATGWLDPQSFEVSGRPVGIAVGPDGALYVSDDKAGLIYRFQYRSEAIGYKK